MNLNDYKELIEYFAVTIFSLFFITYILYSVLDLITKYIALLIDRKHSEIIGNDMEYQAYLCNKRNEVIK